MRTLVALLLFIGVVEAFSKDWQDFKDRFLKDGYIVDPYNDYRVTSEAQGYGMLLAVLYNDKETFSKIWKWTKDNLQRKEDRLFSWFWKDGKVIDKNNAVDADMFIAYSLLSAYEKWRVYSYKVEFEAILDGAKKHFLKICDGEDTSVILIPAKFGYIKDTGTHIYPSYYIPFILRRFYYYSNDEIWLEAVNYLRLKILGGLVTDKMYFSFFEKALSSEDAISMDVYRIILYSFIDKKIDITRLKRSFDPVNRFFKKYGYIPLIYKVGKEKQTQTESPFCVYDWFYMLYKDENYLKKYKDLKSKDKNNYFCWALELIKQRTFEVNDEDRN